MLGQKSAIVRLRVTPQEKETWTAAARRFGDERDDCNLSDFLRGCVEAWLKAHPAKSDEQKKAKRRPAKA